MEDAAGHHHHPPLDERRPHQSLCMNRLEREIIKGVTPSPTPNDTTQKGAATAATTHPSTGALQYMYPHDATNADSNGAKLAVQPSSPLPKAMNNNQENNSKKSTSIAQPLLRKSSRETKSTLVHINGHAVLKQNNYVLKGLSYDYGAHVPDDAPKNSNQKKQKAIHTTTFQQPTKKPRQYSTAELERKQHNDTVQKRVQQKQDYRNAFLASHAMTLQPFVHDRVYQWLMQQQLKQQAPVAKTFAQPDSIQADMRDYQLDGLNWMIWMHQQNLGMILGDEMGLGKTLQAISLFCHLKEKEGITGPSLVICPLSVLGSWQAELDKWAPSLNVLRFHSSCSIEREAQKVQFVEKATSYDVVLTTYEMAKSPQLRHFWSRQFFWYLVLDEGHRIKDAKSLIATAVRWIHCENRLILTGTPLQNNLVELWSLLNFLHPDMFFTAEPFETAFDLVENRINVHKLNQAHDVLGLFMLRRLKSQVEKLMPRKIETKVICPLSNTQIFWYKALLMKDINLLAASTANDGDDDDGQPKSQNQGKLLSNLIMQLRKCCLHPFLFDGAEVDTDSTTCQDLVAASGKLAVLDKLLRSLLKKGHRVVLFSQFTRVLDILEDYCVMRGWRYCRFDGSTARAKRNYIVNRFNDDQSEHFLFLMSTRSGGMGLNLQSADTCILYDSDWNPQPDLQAMARVHRIGQKKTVHVYRLICGGTIEERIVERAEKKLYLDQMVNNCDSTAPQETQSVSKRELLSTLKFGCDAVFGEDNEKQNSLPTDKEIEVITDRNRTETFSDGKLQGDKTKKAFDFEAEREFTATTKLGGIDFKAIRDAHQKKKTSNIPKQLQGIADQWINLQRKKRKKKSRVVLLNSNGSGWGTASVPVLAANNYDLEHGESSVFARELGGRKGNFGDVKKRVKKSGVDYGEQDFCQVCGDGGFLLCCPSCPVCVHQECVGVRNAKHFTSCPHHRCSKCGKNNPAAGGILFPCQSCPFSFCEDCLPTKEEGMRFLGRCDRFEKLGFDSAKHYAYIHCSAKCETYAKKEFGWKIPTFSRQPCPPSWDVSHNFGSKIDETVETPSTLSREQGAGLLLELAKNPDTSVGSISPIEGSHPNPATNVIAIEPRQRRFRSNDEKAWHSMFERLLLYKRKHGNCMVPNNCQEDSKLGIWVNDQRSSNKRGGLSAERKEMLNSIGFTWSVNESWDALFQRLVDYKAKHGDCLVPTHYKDDTKLGRWVDRQRGKKKTGRLSEEQVQRLESIGFVWTVDRKEGIESTALVTLMAYQQLHGK